jgi:hypothetical protein
LFPIWDTIVIPGDDADTVDAYTVVVNSALQSVLPSSFANTSIAKIAEGAVGLERAILAAIPPDMSIGQFDPSVSLALTADALNNG